MIKQHIFNAPPHPARHIDAKELEDLFAEGLTQNQVAARLHMHTKKLSKRIVNSHILSQARQRGKARAKGEKK